MAWKLTGHPKTQRVTKSLADKFATMEAAPHDRPLSETRLRVYEKIVMAGGFRPCSWAAAFCAQTGGTYRVNGKHTSTLFSGMEPLPELYAVTEYYECDTLDDIARLYSTYDSKMNSRTASDINSSFAACVPELAGVDLRTINLSASAVWYAREQDEYKRRQPQERAEALLDHHDFVVWVYDMIGTGNKSHLKRMPVFAAMYATYTRAPRIATEFWQEVRDEDAPAPDAPTRKLTRFLMLNSSRGRAGAHRHLVKDREFFVKSLHAWNAYRAGESTNMNYYATAPVPAIK